MHTSAYNINLSWSIATVHYIFDKCKKIQIQRFLTLVFKEHLYPVQDFYVYNSNNTFDYWFNMCRCKSDLGYKWWWIKRVLYIYINRSFCGKNGVNPLTELNYEVTTSQNSSCFHTSVIWYNWLFDIEIS